MNTSRIFVSLTSDANFLALSILESLLSKNCEVVVLTSDEKGWQKITAHLVNRTHFYITNDTRTEGLPAFNYSVFCGGFISKENAYKSFRDFTSNKNVGGSKRLAILPFESFSSREDGFIGLSDNLGVVYVGDLIGPRLDLDSDLLVSRALGEILTARELALAVGEVISPVFCKRRSTCRDKMAFFFWTLRQSNLLTRESGFGYRFLGC